MFDSKLSERQKTFSKDKSVSNNNTNSLVRKREEMNLELRKNKLFDNILERRLNSLNKYEHLNNNLTLNKKNTEGGPSNKNKSANLYRFEINDERLQIPQILKTNYLKHCDKLSVISKLLEDEENHIDFKKFAIVSMRKFLCDKKEKLSITEITYIYENIYKHLVHFLFEYKSNENEDILEELRIKYETSWILINLTTDSPKFSEILLDIKNLQKLDEILDDLIKLNKGNSFSNNNFQNSIGTINTNELIRHFIWVLSNLLGEDRGSNKIIKNSMKLPERIDNFLSDSDYIQNLQKQQDVCNVIQVSLWAIANLLRYTFSDAKYMYKNLLKHVINIMKICSLNKEVDLEIIRDCLETMIHFLDCQELIAVFIENDTVPLLIHTFSLVNQEENSTNLEQLYQDVYNIVKLFSEFLTVEDEIVDHVLKYPVIEKFFEIITTINQNHTTMLIEEKSNFENDSKILKEVCLAISNITASRPEYIEKIIFDDKMVENIIQVFGKFRDGVKYEIFHIFFNAFYGGNSLIKSEIIKKNIHRLYILHLIEISDSKDITESSYKIIKIILKAFLLFLEYGDKISSKINFVKLEMENENIVNSLEKIQFCQSSELCELSRKLLIRYWTDDECYYEDPSDLINLR
jgi:hypothetical protein